MVPLSVRGGLIEWVQDSSPLYSIYRNWSKYDKLGSFLQADNKYLPSATQNELHRKPSEEFLGRVFALLKEQRITAPSRKEWPLAILKSAFLQLLQETDK